MDLVEEARRKRPDYGRIVWADDGRLGLAVADGPDVVAVADARGGARGLQPRHRHRWPGDPDRPGRQGVTPRREASEHGSEALVHDRRGRRTVPPHRPAERPRRAVLAGRGKV